MLTADAPRIEITYVGGPTAVLSIAGLKFITDPTFDAPGRDYASGTVTLHKTGAPALAPERLGRIDVALVSHDQHPDNLDDAGRALLHDVGTVLTTTTAAVRLGHGAIGLAPWATRTFAAADGTTLRVTATPARHGPAGIEKITGPVVGFVISDATRNEDLVYVTGDTVWYEGTAEVARRFHPRAVVLFAGAATTRGPFHLTMDTNEAVELAKAFAGARIVPVHHDGWAHFMQSQDDLQKTFTVLGLEDRLQRVEPGATFVVAPEPRG